MHSLTVFIQPLRTFTYVNVSTQVDNPKHWQPHCLAAQKYSTKIQLTKIQLTLPQPSETECGCPSGWGIGNSHIRFCVWEKIGILKTFFFIFFIAYVAKEKRNAGGGGGGG